MTMKKEDANRLSDLETLTQIGIALSSQQDETKLLKMILAGVMELTNADAGTLYLVYNDNSLSFSIFANKTLNIKPSLILETELPITSIPLYIKQEPNLKNVVSYCYHKNITIHIPDAYQLNHFDFTGLHNMDARLGYHSQSTLAIPMRDHQNKIIGVLQIINAKDDESGANIPFSEERIKIAESLASQAAISLTKRKLIQEQKKLFDALLQLIAKAIDEKSKYTSNHCERVPIITLMIANALNTVADGPLKDLHLDKDKFEELMIAAWLHDCGKLVIPVYVMDKSTKLDGLFDKIELVKARVEIIKRDFKIQYLEQLQQSNHPDSSQLEKSYLASCKQLDAALDFFIESNTGGEYLSEQDIARIRTLGTQYTYRHENEVKPLLTEDEIQNLSVSRGTLNDAERHIIENHVKISYSMLQSLPYPEKLKNVPEIAGSHHECVNGKGYPRGLKHEQLSIQARILAIADIFEALTSADRPYKSAKPLKEVLTIMGKMKDEGHIDADLFDLFVKSKIYLVYGKQYLKPEQIDID